ncbi:hypothetical protein [Desulfuromonas sp.]|uniref:hypothetical protein n=1 Tax=Desulfuromonas sp. TaxID=892 RepID=UPI0025B8CE96|nr:hypothetical protein [Desulfuromonas sp.]
MKKHSLSGALGPFPQKLWKTCGKGCWLKTPPRSPKPFQQSGYFLGRNFHHKNQPLGKTFQTAMSGERPSPLILGFY